MRVQSTKGSRDYRVFATTATTEMSFTYSTRFSTPIAPSMSARPTSARPVSARPQTAASSRPEGSFVIAIFEGRGIAREVGMAALDKDTGRVVLVQVLNLSN